MTVYHMQVRRRVFEILEVAVPDDLPSRVFDCFIMTVTVMLETVESQQRSLVIPSWGGLDLL
ncbi:MAG: hypothetical protein OD814_000770 [Candidatus Alkanophagales archaeon MCA70_species_1]|nr:hypothetical protein [Candidatus Alkanophaga volatiphilum]